MTRSRAKTKRLTKWDRDYLWHPFTQMRDWVKEEPIIIERGRGAALYDTEGRRYLDGTSSIWLNVHGHRHPALDRALRAQLKKVAHTTLLGLSNPPAIQLARELVRRAPRGLSKVFFSDDGSTAVEVALKMAVQYWAQAAPNDGPKNTFIHLDLAYHGDTAGAMSVGRIPVFHDRYRALQIPTLTAESVAHVEELLMKRHADVAAVIVEPLIQAAGGMLIAPKGSLRKLRRLCTRYGVLLIADEVATGFGRTGRMFACEHEGVTPDLMALSKGLTGGYLPLGATLATDAVYRAFLGDYAEWKTFFHGHSYTGNPLACAVALENLKIFRRERTLLHLQPKIRALARMLAPLRGHPHVGEIRQLGFMVGIELINDRDARIPYPLTDRMGHRVAREARRRGLLLRPLGNVMVLMPPLSTTMPELRRMAAILAGSIEAVCYTPRMNPLRPTRPPKSRR
ncbi:MAG TPA: adenosylmethionine--8-amino-7-oxononanoate transaminase [Nitrospirales bacterium]|nr:adenosylmethionine--8-amino-7-oxononanoate transaminase [Nitrospirales bacterium]